MTSSIAKQLVIVIAATAIAMYLLEQAEPPARHYSYETRHDACAQFGARNHSGVEPYDPFGLCRSGQGRNYVGGRAPREEGRRR